MNKMEHPEYGPREWLCFPNETNALQYPFVHRCRGDVEANAVVSWKVVQQSADGRWFQ